MSFLFILLQRWTGIFSSSKPKSTWKWVGGRVTLLVIFFLNERCSVEPPSYLSVQLYFGDQIHGPFTAGGITARGRSAQQTVSCHMGPKLLSSTTHCKMKSREFLRLFFFFSSKQKNNVLLVSVFKRRKKAKREPCTMLSSQNAVL